MRLSLILLFLHLWGHVEVSFSENVCSRLPNVPHSYVSENTKKVEYREGDVIHFTCETGYISGPTLRYICTNTGWESLRQGKCNLKPCELPEDVPNGYYEIIRGEELVFGTAIKYFCNLGYTMGDSDGTRTCQLDGWSSTVPVCETAEGCEKPPHLSNGDPKESSRLQYSHSERVEYICQDYYRMEGGPYKTCVNGQWTGEMRCLKPCTVKREDMSKHNIQFRYVSDDKLYSEHNDVIEFICSRGRRVGSLEMRQTCIEGVMHLPTCQ
uniref:complement factor H-related protein 2-like isoform X2 n=1 Tax=Maylandia zebra TaxID=106582 RepID=UPI000D2F79EB|nr:complement factor H-related protein 2-like isoform X2 [Maylandia zebra]